MEKTLHFLLMFCYYFINYWKSIMKFSSLQNLHNLQMINWATFNFLNDIFDFLYIFVENVRSLKQGFINQLLVFSLYIFYFSIVSRPPINLSYYRDATWGPLSCPQCKSTALECLLNRQYATTPPYRGGGHSRGSRTVKSTKL